MALSEAPRIRLIEASAFERPVRFRMPFRFGAAKVDGTAQTFVRVRIADAHSRVAAGWSAEMMMPRWFDKNPGLSAAVGATHIERNGHHDVDGMGDAPAAEQSAFLGAHGDLYHDVSGRARLRMEGGKLDLSSVLEALGLGSSVEPDWSATTPLGETP